MNVELETDAGTKIRVSGSDGERRVKLFVVFDEATVFQCFLLKAEAITLAAALDQAASQLKV